MAAQVFSPQFIIVTTTTNVVVTINTSEIRTVHPWEDGKSVIHLNRGGTYYVNRSYEQLNNDLMAKNCK
jgi:hypothetical protein